MSLVRAAARTRRRRARIAALAPVAAVLLALPAGTSVASTRATADLSVRSAKASLEGQTLLVDVVAVNRGRVRARASVAAVSWRPVQGRRVGRSVVLRRVRLAAVRRRGRRAMHVRLTVPPGATGVYEVRVCLDIRGRVRERREHDNCRSAGDVVLETPEAAPDASAGDQQRAPAPAPVVGLPDPGPVAPVITADTTPPETTITSGPPALWRWRTADFLFAASERGSRLECRLDGADWTPCSPPVKFVSLTEGAHVFEVRAIDAAGNVDPTPAAHAWTVDVTRPHTTITDGPTGIVTVADATFAFDSDEPGSTFECRLDLGAWSVCTAPASFTGLADGEHVFDVKAFDPAGNEEMPPVSQAWQIDTSVPPPAP